jgi:hypothetical protein
MTVASSTAFFGTCGAESAALEFACGYPPSATLPRKREREKRERPDQLAAAAGTSRWRFMTILLSAPR